MLIDIFRKPKDKFEFVKEYLDSTVCSNILLQKNSSDPYNKWLNITAQDIVNIFDNTEPDKQNGEIKSVTIHPASHYLPVALTTDELREIYEVLNSEGFKWERGETC
jgi:hypothetical protein